mmetsp:Transcript_54251/g.124427  ORF Transcript_54251/g.124427 Transcript_54251/m.124427 type:complete len:269 (+) Transcript_54251:759-1565(+)
MAGAPDGPLELPLKSLPPLLGAAPHRSRDRGGRRRLAPVLPHSQLRRRRRRGLVERGAPRHAQPHLPVQRQQLTQHEQPRQLSNAAENGPAPFQQGQIRGHVFCKHGLRGDGGVSGGGGGVQHRLREKAEGHVSDQELYLAVLLLHCVLHLVRLQPRPGNHSAPVTDPTQRVLLLLGEPSQQPRRRRPRIERRHGAHLRPRRNGNAHHGGLEQRRLHRGAGPDVGNDVSLEEGVVAHSGDSSRGLHAQVHGHHLLRPCLEQHRDVTPA